jgi:LPXTG-motif cell wall-anchored protein
VRKAAALCGSALAAILVVLVTIALGPTPSAGAAASDPDETDSGKLDVKTLSQRDGQLDADAEEDVMWVVDFHEAFTPETDFFKIQWDFDFNGDGVPSEACLSLEQVTPGVLRGTMFPGCGSENVGTNDATLEPTDAPTHIELKFPKSALVASGLQSNAPFYDYKVVSTDLTAASDTAPDTGLTRHTFGEVDPTPTPDPGASPTPTPDPGASPTPTPDPGASPTPTPTPAPTEVTTATVEPGGTASSDDESDGATADDPVETDVTVPAGGEVTITEGEITADDPSGFTLFGQQVDIDAPEGTPADPLTIVFTIDASMLNGVDIADVSIFRDEAAVSDCTGDAFDDEEDVCVESRETLEDGDGEIAISAVHASSWNFAQPQVASSPTPEVINTSSGSGSGSGAGTGDGTDVSGSGAGSGSGATLPQTGVAIASFVLVAGGLLYAGAELAAWARRRRSEDL